MQDLGALENYVQWDCTAHPEAICGTVLWFMFLNVGKPVSIMPFLKLPLSSAGS